MLSMVLVAGCDTTDSQVAQLQSALIFQSHQYSLHRAAKLIINNLSVYISVYICAQENTEDEKNVS